MIPWNPAKKALRGNLKRAVDFVEKAFAGGAERLTYRDIRAALNVTAEKFREKVTKLVDWTDTLADLGLVVAIGYRCERVIQRACSAPPTVATTPLLCLLLIHEPGGSDVID